MAAPADQALTAEVTPYTHNQRPDLATAGPDLRKEAKTENEFDAQIGTFTFPNPAVAAGKALLQADAKRIKLLTPAGAQRPRPNRRRRRRRPGAGSSARIWACPPPARSCADAAPTGHPDRLRMTATSVHNATGAGEEADMGPTASYPVAVPAPPGPAGGLPVMARRTLGGTRRHRIPVSSGPGSAHRVITIKFTTPLNKVHVPRSMGGVMNIAEYCHG
jgi:hypothetical protein